MIYEEQHIQSISTISFQEDVFERCLFDGVDLSYRQLGQCRFIDCTFKNVNLSMVQWAKSQLQSVLFEDSKLMGVDFTSCSTLLFSVSFTRCDLSMSKFAHLDISHTIFKACQLYGSDFYRTNAHHCTFDTCQLKDSLFESTNLSYADLSSSHGLLIDPKKNDLNRTKVSVEQALQFAQAFNIDIVDL